MNKFFILMLLISVAGTISAEDDIGILSVKERIREVMSMKPQTDRVIRNTGSCVPADGLSEYTTRESDLLGYDLKRPQGTPNLFEAEAKVKLSCHIRSVITTCSGEGQYSRSETRNPTDESDTQIFVFPFIVYNDAIVHVGEIKNETKSLSQNDLDCGVSLIYVKERMQN